MNPYIIPTTLAWIAFGAAVTAVFAVGLEFLPLAICALLGLSVVGTANAQVSRNQRLLEAEVRKGMARRAERGEVTILTTDEEGE